MEVLVGVALFAVITALIAVAFTLAHRYTRVYHQLSTSERECTRCLSRIGHLLQQARTETLQPTNPVNECWFLSSAPPVNLPDVAEFDPTTGELQYQKWQAISLRPNGEVVAAEIPLSGGRAVYEAAILTPAPTSGADFLSAPRQQVLARWIRTFQVRAEPSRLFRVSIEAQTSESGNPATRYTLNSSFPGH